MADRVSLQPRVVRVRSVSLGGVEATPVVVEATGAGPGVGIDVVGLPDAAVRESRQRILRAVERLGIGPIERRVLFNLAPAARRKEGGGLDLPMAVAFAAVAAGVALKRASRLLVVGEIGLDGSVRETPGALLAAVLGRRMGMDGVVVAERSEREASVVEGVEVYGVDDVEAAFAVLRGDVSRVGMRGRSPPRVRRKDERDLADVRGQESAKRALAVAAAGGHNLLMVGPPGSGKTMLARTLPGLLPPLGIDEALECACIHAAVGRSRIDRFYEPPFRAPHHTASRQALVGGGVRPRPGEVTLAHRGVLFLDELPEFGREVLETLRQPVEDAAVTISRTQEVQTFPADFMLVAAMNPCPCGRYGEDQGACRCTPRAVQSYRGRISGPLLDRIDIHLPVRRVAMGEIVEGRRGADSAGVREQLERARAVQAARYEGRPYTLNAQVPSGELPAVCRLGSTLRRELISHLERLRLTGRAYVRVLRVSRTLADLAGREDPAREDLLEAIQYRGLDRGAS